MSINHLISILVPPPQWRIPVIIILGIFFGLGSFVIYISKAPSYLSDNPETCINCHIMTPQYATWIHSSHKQWTVCNDCHVPHDNIFNKYFFKAKDGLRHATIFTLRKEPQVIFIREDGKEVARDNCIRCHEHLLTDYKLLNRTKEVHNYRLNRMCWDCHIETPHGKVNSLSSVTNTISPLPVNPIPFWLKK